MDDKCSQFDSNATISERILKTASFRIIFLVRNKLHEMCTSNIKWNGHKSATFLVIPSHELRASFKYLKIEGIFDVFIVDGILPPFETRKFRIHIFTFFPRSEKFFSSALSYSVPYITRFFSKIPYISVLKWIELNERRRLVKTKTQLHRIRRFVKFLYISRLKSVIG